MSNTTVLLSALVLGAGAGAATAAILDPRAAPAQAAPAAADELALLRSEQAALAARVAELASALETARLSAPAAPAVTRTLQPSEEAIAAAVERYLEKLGPRAAPAAPEPPRSASGRFSGVAEASVDDLLDMLREGGLSGMEEQELWEEIRETDRIDEVLAEYERLASLQPNNPDVQYELGTAYLHKIFDVGSGPLAGKYGTLADESFDRALESDPEHWEARFSKAVALSNWPEFLGKTGEAIQHFEILVGQQESRPPQEHFAQTYFVLGNMYQRKGDAERALATWRKGLALFPDDEALREQIRLNE